MSTVEVSGLKEFNRAVNVAAKEVPGVVQTISLKAGVMVVESAVPTIPRRSGKAAKSVQALATSNGVKVTGGNGIAYFRWLAIGGRSGRNLSNVRRIVKPDRYLAPAYRREQAAIEAMAQRELTNALKRSGFEVT